MAHLTTEILDVYAEGILTPRERTQADAHLATCAECRLAVVSMAQVGDLLRDEPRQAVPDGLAAALIANLEPTLLPPSPLAWSWTQIALSGLGTLIAWMLLIILGGETVLAAYRAGLADYAELIQAQPDLLSRYPSEAFAALVESIPVAELGLTLVTLVVALWLMQRFLATLPGWSRA